MSTGSYMAYLESLRLIHQYCNTDAGTSGGPALIGHTQNNNGSGFKVHLNTHTQNNNEGKRCVYIYTGPPEPKPDPYGSIEYKHI